MSFVNEASKLLTNKYFLYFIVFLAITNVIGYLVTNKLNAIVFFALICLLMTNFSKNMVVILLVAIVATNLLMVNSRMREGMENAPELTDEQKQQVQTQVQAVKNKRSTNAAEPVSTDADTTTDVDTTATPSTASKVDEIKAKVQAKKASTTDTTDVTDATEAVPATDEGFAPAGVGANGKKRGAIGGPAKPSRIDYASTLEDAYDNLDKILGSGGMQNLSADTEKLMNQQKKLFEAMNTMMPLVSKAQDMLQGLDMGKIGQMVDMTKTMSPAKV